jgi:hypothetical protein
MVKPRHRDMESAEDLNPTDHDILDLLVAGRETTGSLADQLEKHANYIRDRIRLMRMNGWIQYHHEPTALHELKEDPR